MATKDPRTIVVKTLLNADEFIALSAECEAADIKQSKLLRDLAKNWLEERNGRHRQTRMEWPGAGQNMAMVLPGRTNYGVRGQRMHL
jgi:hypothetical protein